MEPETLKKLEREHMQAFRKAVISSRFKACGYNITATAESLGMVRQTLHTYLAELGIERPRLAKRNRRRTECQRK